MATRTCRPSVLAVKASQQQAATTVKAAKAAPKNLGRIAAAILANASLTSKAFAEGELSLPEVSLPDVDIAALTASTGGIGDFIADNGFAVGGIAFLLALPVGLNALLKTKDSGVKLTTPANALQALEEDERVILVDIRNKAEVKAEGTPDLRSVNRKLISVPYTQVVKGELEINEAFIDSFAKISSLDEESIVILIDSDGSVSKAAAKDIQDSFDISKLYIVDGGAAEWSEVAPWRSPSKGLSLPSVDLKNVGQSINQLADDFKEAPSITKAGIATGAMIGAGVLLFNEAEVILELAGLVAVGQFLLKLVFADERAKTISEIKTLVDEKVAIQDVGDDLNKIATVLLEETPAAPKPAAAPAAEPAAAVSSNGNGSAVPENVQEAREWIGAWKSKTN